MTDLDRAHRLADLFSHVGDRWREVMPLDLHAQGDSVAVGTETIVRCDDGAWRRLVAS